MHSWFIQKYMNIECGELYLYGVTEYIKFILLSYENCMEKKNPARILFCKEILNSTVDCKRLHP